MKKFVLVSNKQIRPVRLCVQTKGNLASNLKYKVFILRLAAIY